MFGRLWSFVKRHRRKFIFAGVFVGGAVLLSKYARRKLLEYQEIDTAECFANVRRQHHFDSNQRTCNMTVHSMLPNLRDALCTKLDSEALTLQLRTKPANKLEIWEDLKIISFTRTIVAVYSCCMLVVFVRIQLNILGGYMYRDSLINRSGSSTPMEAVVATDAIQKQYLTRVQYLFEQGLDALIRDVEATVKQILAVYSLKDQVSLATVEEIIDTTRRRIEYRQDATCTRRDGAMGEVRPNGLNRTSSLSVYMISLEEKEETTKACYLTRDERILNRLDNETRDMIHSTDFHTVVTTCLDTGFIRLIDRISEYFKPALHDSDTDIPSVESIQMPLAKLIPIVNGLIHSILADSPNRFLQELLQKEQMKYFAANIYEAFCKSQDEHTRRGIN